MSTAEVVERISAVELRATPPEVLAQVKCSILDTLSAGVGAVGDSYGKMVADHVRLQEGPPRAAVWGTSLRTSSPIAAFANGSRAPALALHRASRGRMAQCRHLLDHRELPAPRHQPARLPLKLRSR